jgi:twitching motility protein PilT
MDFTQRSDLDKLLDAIVKHKASDLHIGPGRRPVMRLHGKLQEIPGYEKILTQTDMDHILEKAYRSPTGPSAVQAMDDLDFSYVPATSHERDALTDLAARYRVNAVSCVLGTRMVFRRLPPKPPALAEISVPEACTSIVRTMRQGMILVTGPTGSGKSTTLAAWVRDLLEMGDSLHILTLENPVEFRYDDVDMNAAYITQRELGSSMKDFKSGIKSALREDPDVILVGEMRDMDTIHLAMEAAETGHLVLGTVHTTDVATTVSRIVQVYPPEQQQAARVQLVGSLRMVVCQRLLPSTDGKRAAAREHLIFTPSIRNELLTLPHELISSRLYDITRESGVTMSQSITDLYKENKISQDEHIKWMAILQEEKASVLNDTSSHDMNFDLAPVDWRSMSETLHVTYRDIFPEQAVLTNLPLSSHDDNSATMSHIAVSATPEPIVTEAEIPVVAEKDACNTDRSDVFDDEAKLPAVENSTVRNEISPSMADDGFSFATQDTEAAPENHDDTLTQIGKVEIPPDMPEEIIWAVQDDQAALRAAVQTWLQNSATPSAQKDSSVRYRLFSGQSGLLSRFLRNKKRIEATIPDVQNDQIDPSVEIAKVNESSALIKTATELEDIGWATQGNQADLVDQIVSEPVLLNTTSKGDVDANHTVVDAEKSKPKKKKKPKDAVI